MIVIQLQNNIFLANSIKDQIITETQFERRLVV